MSPIVSNNMPKYIEEKAAALHGGSQLPTHTWSVPKGMNPIDRVGFLIIICD